MFDIYTEIKIKYFNKCFHDHQTILNSDELQIVRSWRRVYRQTDTKISLRFICWYDQHLKIPKVNLNSFNTFKYL